MFGCTFFGRLLGSCIQLAAPDWTVTEDALVWIMGVSADQEICVCPPYEAQCHDKEGFIRVSFEGQNAEIWIPREHPTKPDHDLYGKKHCLTKKNGETLEFHASETSDGHYWLTLR